MKLRFNGNTIRLRLSRSDVQQVEKGNEIIERVTFGQGQPNFSYVFKTSNQSTQIEARCLPHEITLIVPESMAIDWAASDKVGLYQDSQSGQGTTLSISIEKDFQCLHKRPGENETDNFPNPLAKKP